MTKIKLFVALLLLVASAVSCDENKPHYDPITLSFADGSGYLNSMNISITTPMPNEFPPLLISGGDGHYTVINGNEECIAYELAGQTLTIKSIAAGRGTITIHDRTGNVCELQVHVISTQVTGARLYTYPLVKTDGMDPAKKAELEQKIVDDAPTGAWDFGATSFLEDGMVTTAKRYLTTEKDSDYLQYNCTFKGKVPANQWLLIYAQIVTWFVMKSDTEEFALFICQPFTEDGKLMRGYNLIRDVTDRYIGDYPEITRAYEIQTGYPQPDWE